jgi:hypothetical protein
VGGAAGCTGCGNAATTAVIAKVMLTSGPGGPEATVTALSSTATTIVGRAISHFCGDREWQESYGYDDLLRRHDCSRKSDRSRFPVARLSAHLRLRSAVTLFSAAYSGDSNNAASTSPPVTVVVNATSGGGGGGSGGGGGGGGSANP